MGGSGVETEVTCWRWSRTRWRGMFNRDMVKVLVYCRTLFNTYRDPIHLRRCLTRVPREYQWSQDCRALRSIRATEMSENHTAHIHYQLYPLSTCLLYRTDIQYHFPILFIPNTNASRPSNPFTIANYIPLKVKTIRNSTQPTLDLSINSRLKERLLLTTITFLNYSIDKQIEVINI
ncbi:hypothetical protein KQX54_010849 [Cotesia glomerata]|uniref:Uncharacterized protein n=1 Tax=Cotesia glomerata TaxID=32391 RepID=A0AAV7I745_COTGL|nr:hypothetical protein KQX54_010849 [Cotesia glomerata]